MTFISNSCVINVICLFADVRVDSQNILSMNFHCDKFFEICFNQYIEHENDKNVDEEKEYYDNQCNELQVIPNNSFLFSSSFFVIFGFKEQIFNINLKVLADHVNRIN